MWVDKAQPTHRLPTSRIELINRTSSEVQGPGYIPWYSQCGIVRRWDAADRDRGVVSERTNIT